MSREAVTQPSHRIGPHTKNPLMISFDSWNEESQGKGKWFEVLVDESLRSSMNQAKGWESVYPISDTIINNRKSITSLRIYRALGQLREHIEINPDKLNGTPVLRDTRFKISQLFAQFAEGDNITDLAEDLDLDQENLKKLLHAFSVIIDRPTSS